MQRQVSRCIRIYFF